MAIDANKVPGSTHLVDLLGTMHTKHAAGHSDIVLVPTPTNDPEDPLNWAPRRKLLASVSMSIYTLVVGISSAAIYSILVPISEQTGLSIADLVAGTGYMFLFFGWGCLFWQPIALQYGKRPVYLLSCLATMAIMLWAPYTTTNGQWLANKILQGFFGAPIESLCEISVADIYFTHERGLHMSIYAFFLAGSNFLAPVLAGFINDGQGWQWVLYWCAIFNAIGFVFLFFFMEETNYDRVQFDVDETSGSISTPAEVVIDAEKVPVDGQHDQDTGSKTESQQAANVTESGMNQIYSAKTFLQKLKLLDKKRPLTLFRMMQRPLLFFSFPVIFYSGFAYGMNLIWFNVLNATSSLILSSPPYNFRPSMVGLSYVSPLLGVFVGCLWSGYFGDIVVLYLSRRNGGRMEPEYRLWLFLLSLITIPSALILWGVGAAHEIHWFGLIFAMFLISMSVTTGVTITVNYCIDSYKELSGEAMITVICIRNTMSFAIGYGITPWISNEGLQNCFIEAAFVGMACVASFLVMVKYGYKLREISRGRYWKYVNESPIGIH